MASENTKTTADHAKNSQPISNSAPSIINDCQRFDRTVERLVADGKWRAVAALRRRCVRRELRSRYLWAWPTVRGVRQLGEQLRRLGCVRLLSIGCGAGLLEWLLEQSSCD